MEYMLVEKAGLDVVVQKEGLAEPRDLADLIGLVLGSAL
jgi:hypothetical protein